MASARAGPVARAAHTLPAAMVDWARDGAISAGALLLGAEVVYGLGKRGLPLPEIDLDGPAGERRGLSMAFETTTVGIDDDRVAIRRAGAEPLLFDDARGRRGEIMGVLESILAN
jgi:hypothetical protein